ncbi:MAG: UDP-N-acetylmuramoyl-L-alanine--D-glutamate ligase [Bacteroidales bacterium]|jgi:UDP-N-acetylmuramoylalanine--D-glutamate ligase|nr:UDP-N-acetylmuramoyl-L-alanine--D-glutamate ligase [Bacteroidales bacterium]
MTNKQLILILGAGESGVGAAILAQQQGFNVFVSDFGTIADNYKSELQNHAIQFEEGTHEQAMNLINNATTERVSEIIKSPGVPEKSPIIQAIRKAGIPIISELEFAARYTNAKLICITGSNGKTTTTMLTYYMLQQAGLDVALGGNVGKSFALQVAEDNKSTNQSDNLQTCKLTNLQTKYYVLEISSFQLDDMYDFKADIAILLNITPDHLDRYNYNFQNYVDSKMKMLQNMTANDTIIFCADDEVLAQEMQKYSTQANVLSYTIQNDRTKQGFFDKKTITIQNTETLTINITDMQLKGIHNYGNSMAAAIAAQTINIKSDVIRESLQTFSSVEHRLEKLPFTVRGVEYINDSKATNVNSTWYALESMNDNVIWIAGGTDKGNEYEALYDLVSEKVKALICLGVDNAKLLANFSDKVPVITEARSMHEAVTKAYELSQKGDTVLLSPACASFDLFKNYMDRGIQFKNNVRNL